MSETVKAMGRSGQSFTNWSGTQSCQPELFFEPGTTEEIRQILEAARQGGRKVRVVGRGLSFSDLACTEGFMISLGRYSQVLKVDQAKQQVKVQAGCELDHLVEYLASYGLTVPVLGVTSAVTVAGWISTGSHGSAVNMGTSSSLVVAMELMTASGEVIPISKGENSALLPAAALSLGVLGVILTVTLQCQPSFNLLHSQYPATFLHVLDNLEERLASSEFFHVDVFPHTDGVVCHTSSRTTQEITPESKGVWSSFLATVLGFPGVVFLYWLSSFFPSLVPVINRWYYRHVFSRASQRVDSSSRLQTMPGLPCHVAMEWAVDREKFGEAVKQLQEWIRESGFPAPFPVVCRFVKGENIFLSPAYGRDSCYINVMVYRPYGKALPYAVYWEALERIMTPLGGRPHWAKDQRYGGREFGKLYPKWKEFCQLRRELDPGGMFLNGQLQRVFGDDTASAPDPPLQE